MTVRNVIPADMQKFFEQNNMGEMNATQRKKFIAENIHVQTLAKAVRSTMTQEARTKAINLRAKVNAAQYERQLLGIRRDEARLVREEALGINQQERFEEEGQKKKFNAFGAIASIPDKLFGKKGLPKSAANNSNQISLAFLLMVLVVLWSAFAVVTPAVGSKTTRIKLLGNVIGGKARVQG